MAARRPDRIECRWPTHRPRGRSSEAQKLATAIPWRSSFGWSRGGKPLLTDCLLAGIGWLALNLFVFGPRRPVRIHVEAFGPDERPEPVRERINAWLEGWYESDGGERPPFVPYHPFVGPQAYHFPPPVRVIEPDPSRVKPATRDAVAHVLADRLKRELTPDEDRADTALADLGLDSLEAAEVTVSASPARSSSASTRLPRPSSRG